MSNEKLSDITLVVDRSGSMADCREDAQGGINTFIEEQKRAEGDALLTLVHFDTEYDFVERATPVRDVKPYELVPRNMTALLDAVGRSIADAKDRIEKVPEGDRPGIVIFLICTDGKENSSREFSKQQVRNLVAQQTAAGWKFLFVGANDAAFAEAGNIGIAPSHVVQTPDSKAAYEQTSGKVNKLRSALASGQSIGSAAYTDEERAKMGDESK